MTGVRQTVRFVCVAAAVLGGAPRGAAGVTRELAEVCARKIDRIAAAAPAEAVGQQTTLSEPELNSWLAYVGTERIPAGVTEPGVTLLGGGRLTGRAVVDLDQVAAGKRRGGALDPWTYLGGRMPVAATGRLRTAQGVGRFELESAQIRGVPVPKWLLQDLVSFYARSPSRPAGLSLDEPFPLPVGIEEVEVRAGQAVVLQ